MIDTTQLPQLISAFRVETEKESISPETVGSLLLNITDLLASAVNATLAKKIGCSWGESLGCETPCGNPGDIGRAKNANAVSC